MSVKDKSTFLSHVMRGLPDYEEHPWSGVSAPCCGRRILWIDRLDDQALSIEFIERFHALGYNRLALGPVANLDESLLSKLELLKSKEMEPLLFLQAPAFDSSPADPSVKGKIREFLEPFQGLGVELVYFSQLESPGYRAGPHAEPLSLFELALEEIDSIGPVSLGLTQSVSPVVVEQLCLRAETREPLFFYGSSPLVKELGRKMVPEAWDSLMPAFETLSLLDLEVWSEAFFQRAKKVGGVVVSVEELPDEGSLAHLFHFLLSALCWKPAPLSSHYELWCSLYQPTWGEKEWKLLKRGAQLREQVEVLKKRSGQVYSAHSEQLNRVFTGMEELLDQGRETSLEKDLIELKKKLSEELKRQGYSLNPSARVSFKP